MSAELRKIGRSWVDLTQVAALEPGTYPETVRVHLASGARLLENVSVDDARRVLAVKWESCDAGSPAECDRHSEHKLIGHEHEAGPFVMGLVNPTERQST